LIYKFFYYSIGRIIRFAQRSLIKRSPVTVLDLVHKNSIEQSAQYAMRNFGEATMFYSKPELWTYCLSITSQLQLSNGGIIAEFGVYKGESINFFAKKCPNARLFGFDSFQGLEENWYGYSVLKGHFNVNKARPKVERNVKLIEGWFKDTLPNFINELGQEQILILHMDADTYSPTKYVLNSVIKNLSSGSILIFDEYFGYPNYERHEMKAFQEIVITYGIKYKYIAYTNAQVAVVIS